MNDVIVRQRYPRRNTNARKKKRYPRESPSLTEKISRQTVFCILILMIIGIIKNVNSPVAGFLIENVKWVTSQNIEAKSIVESMDNIVGKITNGSFFYKDNNSGNQGVYDNNAVPASTGVYKPETSDAGDTERDSTSDSGSENSKSDESGKQEVQKTTRGIADENKPSVSAQSNTDSSTDDSKNSDSLFIAPVNGVVGGSFGERIHPMKKTLEFHKGIDIEANKGSSIKAARGGEVIESGAERTLGNYIRIKHDNGFTTLYAHCSVLISKKGQKVKQGDVIAKVGDTGLSIGAHLHFEVWKDGNPVDPLKYVKVPLK